MLNAAKAMTQSRMSMVLTHGTGGKECSVTHITFPLPHGGEEKKISLYYRQPKLIRLNISATYTAKAFISGTGVASKRRHMKENKEST
ncbi:hypothetical protein E2C01_027781 [Portunus trituberculatus]|uniref:Uncharacterized protein n=1 Tax=Portunus trituberculatus TaxID=210409 RepID=A0A5B7EPS6_PORTR|nr:hypothetical protein [Portunus trituberculatus]